MEKLMKRIWTVALLTMISLVAKAQVTVEFGEGFTVATVDEQTTATKTGGTITVTGQTANEATETETASTTVTIKVTPAEGYYITKADVKVYLTIPIPDAGTRNEVSFESPLALTNVDPAEEPKDRTAERTYSFTVPAGFGAVVYTANFQSADALYNIGGGENPGDVTWALSEDRTEMIIKGSETGGATKDFNLGEEGFVDPFEAFRAEGSTVTSIVIGETVTALGKNIFKGFVGLTTITIENKTAILVLGEDAITPTEGLTIIVPGNLYNEYVITDGWKELTIKAADDAEEMKGIAFDENNKYRAFVSIDKPLLIPSVLKAYIISGLSEDGTSLVLKEINDQIIPAGVPVLVFAANSVKEGFVTSTTEKAGAAKGKFLKYVDKEEGKEVGVGQVYVLFNDKFYFSQAGTLPAGYVYLDMTDTGSNEEFRTRSSFGITADGTTGIKAIENGKWKNENDAYYNLNGQRVDNPTKGIYIKHGKKVVIK